MIRDITIGQYYPVKSRIHSLDPRVKIICTLLFLVSLFVQSSFLGYVIATLFLGMVIYMSKVPLKYIVKGLKPIVILLMFTVVMNLFLTRGGETLLHFWIFTITEEGVRTSVFMALRLMYLVAGSSLMTFTTSPNGLMDGMEKLLNPLNKLHLPVHEVAMIMSIALRFIPILLEETDKIMKAQIARGADFESSGHPVLCTSVLFSCFFTSSYHCFILTQSFMIDYGYIQKSSGILCRCSHFQNHVIL